MTCGIADLELSNKEVLQSYAPFQVIENIDRSLRLLSGQSNRLKTEYIAMETQSKIFYVSPVTSECLALSRLKSS